MSKWYVRMADGQELGPISGNDLRLGIQEGSIPLDARVAQEGDHGWAIAEEAFGRLPVPPATKATRAAIPGGARPKRRALRLEIGGWALLGVQLLALVALVIAARWLIVLGTEWSAEIARQEAARQEIPRWEYKVTYVMSQGHDRVGDPAMKFASITPDDDDMSKLGKKGWQLVSSYLEMETAFPNFGKSKYVTGIRSNIRPQRLVLLFRRRLWKKSEQ